MRLRWGLYLAILAAPVVGAGTIDVSAEASAVVHTGDTLVFQLLTRNFGVNAAGLDLPRYPTGVNFDWISAPLSVTGGFDATLESADRAVSVAFDSLSFGPGYIQSSEYTGAVSTIQGYLQPIPDAFGSALWRRVRRHRFAQRRAGCHGRLSALRAAAEPLRQPVERTALRRAAARRGGTGKPGRSDETPGFGGAGAVCSQFGGAGAPVGRVVFGRRSTLVRALSGSGGHFPSAKVGALPHD
jgi:hypothetical protein